MKAATVSSLSGEAYIERDGQRVALAEGSEISQSDIVLTEENSKVELRFMDDSIIELGPSTQVSINDFAFDPSGQNEPSFAVHMMGGVVRSISGKIVEQNPESFKLTSPLGAVGIRGTETLHVIGQSEIHSIINMEAGHTVVISTPDGRSIVLTQALKGVGIAQGDSGPLKEMDVTPDWVQDFFKQVGGDSVTSGGESPRGFYVSADAAFLSGMKVPTVTEGVVFVSEDNIDTLTSALEEAGVDIDAFEEVMGEVLTVAEEAPVYTASVESSFVQPPAYLGGAPDPVAPEPEGPDTGQELTHTGDLNTALYGDQQHINAGDTAAAQTITVTGNVLNSGIVYGDAQSINSASGANDSIIVQGGMTQGTIYGDATSMNNAGIGGNDTITINGNVTGSSRIFGDAQVVQAGANGGNDSITVSGNITGGTSIYGDAHTMNNGNAGNDTINLSQLSNSNYIYGDALTFNNNANGGNDSITVSGNVSGNNMIYGDAKTMNGGTAGYDTISVGGNVASGTMIYGDAEEINGSGTAGNDSITVTGSLSGASNIYGDANLLQGGAAAGNDVINVGELGYRAIIYGDAHTLQGNAQAGADSITIGSMSGGTIYGDADSINGSVTGLGGNTITITGEMTGGSIYATTAGQNAGAANSISIGSFKEGSVYMADNTTLTLKTIAADDGEIHFSSGADTVIFGKTVNDDQEVTLNGVGVGDMLKFDSSCYSMTTGSFSISDDDYTVQGIAGGKDLEILFDSASSVTGTISQSGGYYTLTIDSIS